jgi:hypothetical protein
LNAQNLVNQPAGAPVRASLRAIAIVLTVIITMLGAVGIRWAKRHPTGAQLLASPAPQRAPAARGMSANRAVGPKHSYSTSRLTMRLRFVDLSQSL